MFQILIGGNYSAVLDRQIQALSDASLTSIMEATGRATGVAAESVVSPYPPASGKPLAKFYPRQDRQGRTYVSKFKSIRQQHFVMGLVAQGKVPYRRTGLLGRSITSDVSDVSPIGVTVKVGTNVSYAPFVIDRDRQSHYFQGNWIPLQNDIENNMNVITDAASAAYVRAVRALL